MTQNSSVAPEKEKDILEGRCKPKKKLCEYKKEKRTFKPTVEEHKNTEGEHNSPSGEEAVDEGDDLELTQESEEGDLTDKIRLALHRRYDASN